MPKPLVRIGNIYESKDRREEGRRVIISAMDPERSHRWICSKIIGDKIVRSRQTKLSTQNLQKKWRLILDAKDTLQPLLQAIENAHPDELPPALRELQIVWIKAGCPGLKS